MSDLARGLPTLKTHTYQYDKSKKREEAKFMAFDLMGATKNRRLLYYRGDG
ncbi:hypothetical protein [Alteromonas sp. PRIM-21]|uniref:hypothetical protein n=1 Tax=Alteromonas sp. PRIM-21 TaxID=1454978 RepID=UPI0022B9A0D7|nr:hypothetical protein [Alteromonas sp. PRIM-21]MCZ8527940.1 hypothetical protein [Alteromonas sp. PRIM-21]